MSTAGLVSREGAELESRIQDGGTAWEQDEWWDCGERGWGDRDLLETLLEDTAVQQIVRTEQQVTATGSVLNHVEGLGGDGATSRTCKLVR